MLAVCSDDPSLTSGTVRSPSPLRVIACPSPLVTTSDLVGLVTAAMLSGSDMEVCGEQR